MPWNEEKSISPIAGILISLIKQAKGTESITESNVIDTNPVKWSVVWIECCRCVQSNINLGCSTIVSLSNSNWWGRFCRILCRVRLVLLSWWNWIISLVLWRWSSLVSLSLRSLIYFWTILNQSFIKLIKNLKLEQRLEYFIQYWMINSDVPYAWIS